LTTKQEGGVRASASGRGDAPSPRCWWKHGTLYQIYPRSFLDSSGDGVGDLEGIRRKLDHLAWLGVDGVWISPCFVSPMADFGYDVADSCAIDPLFGDLDDLDRLVEEAHQRGLKVMLDWVPNHTSDQHPWFLESRQSRESAKRDWYIWRDPAPDGGPPNNWVSVFAGSAWELDERSGQYYLHSYLKEQPDLNWRNPAVEAAMHDTLRFWLDRGVDGFRIDVIHRIGKHADLPDNPPATRPPAVKVFPAYDAQQHIHDEDDPVVHTFIGRLRALLDSYDERAFVGEVFVFDPETVSRYVGPGQLHLAFNFAFLATPWSAEAFFKQMEPVLSRLPEASWPTWVLSNHDLPRAASRYQKAGAPDDDERLKVAALMLTTLRGTPWVYYGEEIGMRDVPVPKARWQDPVSRTIGPEANRDPCRTPMQWAAGRLGGFTDAAEAWLPVGDASSRNVETQRAQETSLLHAMRRAIAFRRDHPVLQQGSVSGLSVEGDVLRYRRELDGVIAHVALNFGEQAQTVAIKPGVVVASCPTSPDVVVGDRALTLPADSGVVVVMEVP
jgi:alpha-glucosidase